MHQLGIEKWLIIFLNKIRSIGLAPESFCSAKNNLLTLEIVQGGPGYQNNTMRGKSFFTLHLTLFYEYDGAF